MLAPSVARTSTWAERPSLQQRRCRVARAVRISRSACVSGALASSLLLAPQRSAKARRRQRVAQAAAVVAFEEQDFEQEEAEEAQEELEQPGAPAVAARVARRVADVVIVITDPLGQEDTNRLPAVGETVQFSSGAIAYVVALGDLCFAGVLTNVADEVEEGDSYQILPRASMLRIQPPEAGGKLLDYLGYELGSQPGELTQGEREKAVSLFNEIVGMVRRQRINAPMHAGVMGLDAFVPIGQGQSMLLRLPPGLSQRQLFQYMAHIVKAQEGNDVQIFAGTGSALEAAEIKSLVGESEAAQRLVVVSGRGDSAKPGEAVLAQNAACALAEAARDSGKHALLLLDLEQLYKVWNLLSEVSTAEHLTEIADNNLKKDINGLTEDLGIELWKYVARKNAASGRRRTFLGCFLQRAGRMSEERGGGSLTLLAFARLKDSSQLSRLELEAKLRNLRQMQLDEAVRERAIAKVEQQLSEIAEDDMGNGVPDDFLEEAKAVTDGHVVLLDNAINEDGEPMWAIDIQESVARGITANSVQNPYLDMLESLKLKAFLMNAEKESQVMDNEDMDVKLDNAPLCALMQQSVGDVLSPQEEAILLALAEESSAKAAAARPLAEAVLELLRQARIRMDDAEERKSKVSLIRSWAEGMWQEGQDIQSLVTKSAEDLAEQLQLKPLERKRLMAAVAEGPQTQEEDGRTAELSLAEDAAVRYRRLRPLVDRVAKELPAGLDPAAVADEDVAMLLAILRVKSQRALES